MTVARKASNAMFIDFAHVLADISADAILPYFRKPFR